MSSVATVAMLAHQGSWDEVVLVAGPMVIIAGLLVLAKRRVDAAAGAAASEGRPTVSSPDDRAPDDHAPDDRASS